ncbi:MAG: nodulation protein NodN [Rhodobacteraceae bacterium]|nr:nodulation protein NodN [Paracoccaceae bacterium]MBR25426.1 nodulation protein NodN [Paracoccaceae bacterium]
MITENGVEDYDPRERDVPEWTIDEFQSHVGQEIGVSPWYDVTQKDVDAFAVATDDRNFIHVNPARAKESGLPGTIAHGFFTLSLLAGFSYKTTPKLKGAVMGYNYGVDKARFVAQVPVGSRVRGRYTLADVQVKEGAVVTAYDVKVEIEGQELANGGKPALVATSRGYAVMGDDA